MSSTALTTLMFVGDVHAGLYDCDAHRYIMVVMIDDGALRQVLDECDVLGAGDGLNDYSFSGLWCPCWPRNFCDVYYGMSLMCDNLLTPNKVYKKPAIFLHNSYLLPKPESCTQLFRIRIWHNIPILADPLA
jgi:hypothetical protein